MKICFSHWPYMVFLLPMLTGLSCHRPMVYTPDIFLKNNGQPCISIPADEIRFHSNQQFEIIMTEVALEGKKENWTKYYYKLPFKYYTSAQKCLNFDYTFQNNISYSINFVSAIKENKNIKSHAQKTWVREFRIVKNNNGSAELLLDLEARQNK